VTTHFYIFPPTTFDLQT